MNSYVVTKKSTNASAPHSPVEVQAVARRPLLPHVYVLPHGAVPAAEHKSRQRHQSDTSPVWPEAPQPPEIPDTSHRAKMSAKHKLSKRPALADCSHHCCLPACLSRSSLLLFLPLPLPMLCLAGPPGFSTTAGQTRAAFANKCSSVLAIK